MTGSASDRWVRPGVILVATDLHDLSRMMPFAVEQAIETGARLILLHVLASASSISTDAAGLPYYDCGGAVECADRALMPWCDYARQQGVKCDALVREGIPAQQVVAAPRQFQADRVLIGTRSRGKLSKLLAGSVAEQVLRSVYLPVMTVGPEAHLPVDSGHDRVVLYATTLRETSRPSAALACQIAAQQGARLVLLHVMTPKNGYAATESHEIAAARDAAVAEEMRKLAADTSSGFCGCVEPVVVHGNPTIEILAKADELNASLVVLGATDRSALGNLTRDRTVYQVLAHSRCPVLTLREVTGGQVETLAEPAEAMHH